jgi:PAS domain S-box-containing protein
MIDKSEQARLKELYAYNILHTPQEPDFDNITQLVAAICNTPTAFILFIDHNQTWIKSEVGLNQDILPYLNPFIASALLNKTNVVVSNDPDLSQQDIRFFAAAPLISPNGYVLGMFCILDNETRALSKLQLTTLTTLTAQVMLLLESHRQEHLLKQISHERDLFNKRLVLQSERLEKEREFLRALLENLQEGIVACDENGKLSLFNRTTREIHGMHEQRLPPDQWSEHYNLYLADGKTLMPFEQIPLFRAYRGEKIIEEELIISPKNHPARTVKCNGQPILRADGTKLGAVVAMRDITEQKAKEVALAKSEAKLLAIFNQSYIFQGLMNTEGDLIDANDLAFDACGYQREQEIGKKFWETSWWNKDVNIAQQIHDMVLRGLKGKISQSGSDYFIASGERRQTELVFSPIRDEHGQITYLLVSGQDVTDRKKNDIELARVNRALRLLSTSVELLIRSNDESKLLNDVCELIVKMGGYELAWAGYSFDDAEKSIRPVAHFGDADYLQGIQLSWSEDKVTGNGPAGRAVRSRQPIVIKDIRADRTFSPWAASAMAHGYLGVICLPLAHQDKVFGLIAMYTKTPIEIVESEVTLLRELADDLAFGIMNIRIQEESKRFHTALFKMAASVSASIDQEFFLQLTQNMCEATGAGIGMVAKLQTGEETSLQSIATVKDGQSFAALTIPMVSEDCQQFIAKDCFILDEPSCLQSLPSLRKFNILSCVGHRLSDRDGNVIGIIAVMGKMPNCKCASRHPYSTKPRMPLSYAAWIGGCISGTWVQNVYMAGPKKKPLAKRLKTCFTRIPPISKSPWKNS